MRSMPALHKLCSTKTAHRRKKIIRGLTEQEKEHACRLLELGFRHIPEKEFSTRELKCLYVKAEALRFLRDIGKCSKKKREEKRRARDEHMIQSGGSLTLLLSVVVPTVADLIYTKLITPRLSKT